MLGISPTGFNPLKMCGKPASAIGLNNLSLASHANKADQYSTIDVRLFSELDVWTNGIEFQ